MQSIPRSRHTLYGQVAPIAPIAPVGNKLPARDLLGAKLLVTGAMDAGGGLCDLWALPDQPATTTSARRLAIVPFLPGAQAVPHRDT